jgi:hypothetical protein
MAQLPALGFQRTARKRGAENRARLFTLPSPIRPSAYNTARPQRVRPSATACIVLSVILDTVTFRQADHIQNAPMIYQHRERLVGAVRFALFKVVARLPRGVCYMCKTRHPHASRACESVKSGRFHFSTARMPLSRAASMASAVSRNGASVVQLDPTTQRCSCADIAFDAVATSRASRLCRFGWRRIVIAGPLGSW